ncbi:MAG TPA: hypothetical protein GX711_02875 [Clostridia bacterium]|nr:hypothetical protein [Clostridia bacterium]
MGPRRKWNIFWFLFLGLVYRPSGVTIQVILSGWAGSLPEPKKEPYLGPPGSPEAGARMARLVMSYFEIGNDFIAKKAFLL